MYSDTDLEAAVSAGALSPQEAQKFRDYVAASRATPIVDEEHFRLLTGFNDIFVAIAAVILLVALAWIGHSFPPHIDYDGPTPWMGVFVAAAAWGLAEFFTKKRRMALPSILLLLAFVGGTFVAAAATLVVAIGEQAIDDNERLGTIALAVSAAVAAGAAWLHWRRFRVPITVAAGTAAVVALLMFAIASAIGDVANLDTIMLTIALLLGIGVFLFAMSWDASDPMRQTRRSDVAFWLHLLSAPLIVHPVFVLLGLTEGTASTGEAILVIALYVGLGLAALAIDRRALLVSALAYVLYALNQLFEDYGAVELSFALTALVIGSALLLLSAFWHTARRGVVKTLPAGVQSKLPVVDRPIVAAAA